MPMVILGAGLSGLSAAYHGGGKIYEKTGQIGGNCISPKVNEYTFDLGIHVLHTKNEYVLDLLQHDLKLLLNEQERSAWIYSFDKLTRYPFQVNTFGLPMEIVEECLIEFINAYNKRGAEKDLHYENYEEWIYAMFGKGIAEYFMIPYSRKFWTVSPKDMAIDWLDARIPIPTINDVVRGALTDQKKGFGPNARFRYPLKGGISALPESFLKKGLKVTLNKKAIAIDINKKEITFLDGATVKYNVLISTIPLPELLGLMAIPDNIKMAVNKLKYNSILCVNIGIDKDNINKNHWIYYPSAEYIFFRISFLKNFSARMVPSGKSSITAEISYSNDFKIEKDSIAKKVINDLIRANILDARDRIELEDIRDVEYGYVIYDHNRKTSVENIKAFLKEYNIVVAGRYGSWEYQWMDDAILDGKRAAAEAIGLMKSRNFIFNK